MTETDHETIFEDDPVLGTFIAFYPSNRLRLLIIAGVALAIVWFVITVLLWQVEATIAATITVIVLAIATLGAGWYVTHFWNREVILYERGFTYREGSNLASIPYREVDSVRQDAQLLSYFGGLVRRSTLRYAVTTSQDETIVLTFLYRKADELITRLDKAITTAILPRAETQLAQGETLVFSDTLQMTHNGLRDGARTLPWVDFHGFHTQDGHLVIEAARDAAWYRVPLNEVVNLLLLVSLLKKAAQEAKRQPDTDQQEV